MSRVSRDWVICLAEPDHGGPGFLPARGRAIGRAVRRRAAEAGGRPGDGKEGYRACFIGCGLRPEVGVHPGMWDVNRAGGGDEEWRLL